MAELWHFVGICPVQCIICGVSLLAGADSKGLKSLTGRLRSFQDVSFTNRNSLMPHTCVIHCRRVGRLYRTKTTEGSSSTTNIRILLFLCVRCFFSFFGFVFFVGWCG